VSEPAYHVTHHDRALEVLAHGFTGRDAILVDDDPTPYVRLWVRPDVADGRLPGFALEGDVELPDALAWLADAVKAMPEPDADPREWEPELPPALVYDPDFSAHTVLAVTLPEDVSLDEYRHREAVKLRNRRTGEIRRPSEPRWHWAGEWLVPLPVVQRARVRLLEATLSAEDEAFLQEALVRWRAEFEREGLAPEEIERQLADIEARVRSAK